MKAAMVARPEAGRGRRIDTRLPGSPAFRPLTPLTARLGPTNVVSCARLLYYA